MQNLFKIKNWRFQKDFSYLGAFIVNFKQTVLLFLMFLSLTLTICLPTGLSKITICDKVLKLWLFSLFLLLAIIHFICCTNSALLMFENTFWEIIAKDKSVLVFQISTKLFLFKLMRRNPGKNRSGNSMIIFLHIILILFWFSKSSNGCNSLPVYFQTQLFF